MNRKIKLVIIVLFICITTVNIAPQLAEAGPYDSYFGDIIMFAGTYAPSGWALCEGQTLYINQYTHLFSIIGTKYGGDGKTTFRLPDLRSRIPVGTGNGPGLTPMSLGLAGGSETVTLAQSNLPAHSHSLDVTSTTSTAPYLNVSSAAASSYVPTSSVLAVPNIPKVTGNMYKSSSSSTDTMASGILSGDTQFYGSQQPTPYNNVPPYLGINYIICVNECNYPILN